MLAQGFVVGAVDGDLEGLGGVALDDLVVDQEADRDFGAVAVFEVAGLGDVVLLVDRRAQELEESGGFVVGMQDEVDALNDARNRAFEVEDFMRLGSSHLRGDWCATDQASLLFSRRAPFSRRLGKHDELVVLRAWRG